MVDHPGAAFEHAQNIARLEHALGLGFERALSDWVSGIPALERLTSWAYVYSHFVVTTVTLAWVYLRRNASFYFVRNMFVVAMAIALVLYVVYPTAPPRFLPELGFGDPVARVTGVEPSTSGVLVNPYAAVPSMHVAFALMLAGPLAGLARRTWAEGAVARLSRLHDVRRPGDREPLVVRRRDRRARRGRVRPPRPPRSPPPARRRGRCERSPNHASH